MLAQEGFVFIVDSRTGEQVRRPSVIAEALVPMQALLASIVASSYDAIITCDLAGNITSWNETAETMFLYSPEEVLGRSFGMLLVEAEHLKRFLGFARGRERVKDQQLELVRKDGSTAEFSLYLSPILGSDTNVSGVSIFAKNVSRRKEIEAKLLLQHNLQDLVLNSISEGLIVADSSGSFTLFNDAAERILGLGPIDIDSSQWCQAYNLYLPGETHLCPQDQMPLAQALAGHSVKEFQLRVQTPGSGVKFISCNAEPLRDASGILSGAVIVFHDITEKKRIEATLQDSLVALQRSNKDLEQFASVAAHDLQEPLRSVTNYLELFLAIVPVTDETAVRYVGKIRGAVTRMQALVNALLSYARIESRGQPFCEIDCNSVLNNCIENLRSKIDQTNAQITYSNLPTVWGDASQIGQVFENLLSNAIKFSKGEPKIEVSAERNGRFWDVKFQDNGIGIQPEFFDRIFLIFQRLHSASTYQGTGIGLSICKRIVERHGGKMTVKSALNEGTTFIATLPAGLND
ncbi:MAG: hypothetical protein C0469_07810 [Cyanobacteria bacterium DS2.3.42]|nr:hypothetical protein [Cyanobacteria bacterium DS2.3.42]